MFKRLKSIIAVMMAVAMLTSICCVPAMATESEIERNQFVHSPIYLSTSRIPSFLFEISGNIKTVRHKLVGLETSTRGQSVVFRIRNLSTGATRSFTAASDWPYNGGWLSDTYNTPIPEGQYQLEVVSIGANGTYGVQIYFEP